MLRLRRLRGMTQEQLAERMGTRQPAIARLERGHANTTLATLVAAAEALDATVRVDLDPVELLGHEPRAARWWDRVAAPTVAWHAVSPEGETLHVTLMIHSASSAVAPVASHADIASARVVLSVEDEAVVDPAPARAALLMSAWSQVAQLG